MMPPPDYAGLAQRAALLSPDDRSNAVSAILQDLSQKPYHNAPLEPLQVLKVLGRSQSGTEALATDKSLRLLINYSCILSSPPDGGQPIYQPLKYSKSKQSSQQFPDRIEVAAEALRIIANTLILHQQARSRILQIDGISKALIKCLGDPAPKPLHFLSSRILFLVTAGGDDIIMTMVDEYDIGPVFGDVLSSFVPLAISEDPDSRPNENLDTLTEHLKFLFNITLWYPRILAITSSLANANINNNNNNNNDNNHDNNTNASNSQTSSRSNSPMPPGTPFDHQSNKSQPISSTPMSPSQSSTENSSMKAGVKNLFNRASELMRKDTDSSDRDDASTHRKSSRGAKSRSSKNSNNTDQRSVSLNDCGPELLFDKGFEKALEALVTLAMSLHLPSTPAPIPPLSKVIESLLNFPFTRNFSKIVYATLPDFASKLPYIPTASPNRPPPYVPPLAARMLVILDSTTRYFMGPVDDFDTTQIKRKEAQSDIHLDSVVSSLILLLRKCCVEHLDNSVRHALRDCLLPHDIDRSKPLEKRADLTGRLLRILTSVYLSKSKDSVGEFLFSLCNQVPKEFCLAIGYGNASGFLASANILIPPPSTEEEGQDTNGDGPSSSTSSGQPGIDPITGAHKSVNTGPSPMDDMTPEEQEREAERLYTLFERLQRTGVVSTKNPVHEAHQSGRIEELTREEEEEEERRRAEQEEQEEKEAMEEIKRYKARTQKASSSSASTSSQQQQQQQQQHSSNRSSKDDDSKEEENAQ